MAAEQRCLARLHPPLHGARVKESDTSARDHQIELAGRDVVPNVRRLHNQALTRARKVELRRTDVVDEARARSREAGEAELEARAARPTRIEARRGGKRVRRPIGCVITGRHEGGMIQARVRCAARLAGTDSLYGAWLRGGQRAADGVA